jgi:26S proteasome regulatory subunit T4
MSLEDPGSVSFAGIGGLGDQVRELREVIELPLMNPELFEVSLYFLLFKRASC